MQAQKLSIELVVRAEAVVHKNRTIEAGILWDLRDAYRKQLLKHREEWKQSGNFAWALIIRQDQQAWDPINDRCHPTSRESWWAGSLKESEAVTIAIKRLKLYLSMLLLVPVCEDGICCIERYAAQERDHP